MPLQSATSMCSRTKTMTTSLTVSDPLPAHKSSMPPAPCKKTSRLQFAQSVRLATTVGRACRRTSCATTRTAKQTALRLLNMPVLKSQHCLSAIRSILEPHACDELWRPSPVCAAIIVHCPALPAPFCATTKQHVMLATFLGTPPRFLGQHSKTSRCLHFLPMRLRFCAPNVSCPSQTARLNTLSLCVGFRKIPR